jgi:hypothetical protein
VLAEHPHDIGGRLATTRTRGAQQLLERRHPLGALKGCDVPGEDHIPFAVFLTGLEATLDEDREQAWRLAPEGLGVAAEFTPQL